MDAGMPKKFARRVDVCSLAVRVIVAKVWRQVWKVTSLLIPACFAMVFKVLLAAPCFKALGKTNWPLASFGFSGIHDFACWPSGTMTGCFVFCMDGTNITLPSFSPIGNGG